MKLSRNLLQIISKTIVGNPLARLCSFPTLSPKLGILGLRFIGAPILKLITVSRLKARLAKTMEVMGVKEACHFNAF